jgi:hypothetical protein
MLFAIEARAAGLRVVLLGADTPLEEVAVAVRRGACDAVILASSVDPSPGIVEKRLPALVKEAGVPIFVGGSTAGRLRAAISAAGAIPMIGDMEHAVRLIVAALGEEARPR